jgi:hypothetical protein
MRTKESLGVKKITLSIAAVLGMSTLMSNAYSQESLGNPENLALINYKVESGDSLGWLAEQLRGFGGTYQQRRKFIAKSSPNIFINGDLDSLQHGSTMSLDLRTAEFYVAPASPIATTSTNSQEIVPLDSSTSAGEKSALAQDEVEHSAGQGSHKVPLPDGLRHAPYDSSVFKSDPDYSEEAYDAEAQKLIYGGKRAVFTPRPLLELGRPQYQAGPLQRSGEIALNEYNRATTALHVYGDLRTGVAFNHDGKNDRDLIAGRLNLDIDLKLTGTERLHAFVRPLDKNNQFTRIEFQDDGDGDLIIDGNLETLFFEGDLGAIVSTIADKPSPFDLPFAVGLMPLLFQNGLWLEDAFTGAAFTIPARNSRTLDISNFDITFFAGFDKVSSPGILDEFGRVADDDVHLYGIASFWELWGGYAEVDYAFIDGQDQFDDLDHHNFSFSFSKRYKNILSTSIRYLTTFGQDPSNREKTADGTLLVWENSLITSKPSTFIPYANFFAAFDRPQSVARDNGGLLKTVGINFETDALTGYPLLDDTGQDVWGAAIGLQNLFSLDQQLVIELATVQLMDDDLPLGKAVGDQYALGVRYQRPLSRAWIFRADAIKGWLEDDDNFSGVRVEFRRKF